VTDVRGAAEGAGPPPPPLPLAGVRVVDLTRVLAGPFASSILSSLGAEVIKVEPPGEPDTTREIGKVLAPGISAYFLSTNSGKKAISVDLKSPRGRAVLLDLVRVSDVLLENFRPGVMERLSLSPTELRAANEGLVTASVTSFGETGPRSAWPAFDLVIQAASGAMAATGEPGRPPVRFGFAMGDLAGGLFAAIGVLAALLRRERGEGRGLAVSVSLEESLTSLSAYLAQYALVGEPDPGPVGSGHPSIVPYGAYRTADGWLVVGVIGEKFWRLFCRAAGLESLAADPRFALNRDRLRNRAELEPLIATVFAARGTDEWLRRLRAEGVPAGPVRSIGEALADPAARASGFVGVIADPRLPGGSVEVLRSPVRFDGGRASEPSPAPAFGEHTKEVLRSILGYSEEEIAELLASGVVRDGNPDAGGPATGSKGESARSV
jgi:crotonobetainyl-CoA:carnitine CoA-transferase CaiB-like acyl-CoA transferase